MTAFTSWSGGKDSALALYKAVKDKSIHVSFCLNMITDDGKYSRSHGVRSEIVKAQTEAMGLPVLQPSTTWDNYEEKFKAAVYTLKKKGVNTGIFGDIDIEAHRQWVESVCRELDITPILPLWLGNREQLMREFIEIGFKAVVTAVNGSYMGQEWLGRVIDDTFLADLKNKKTIDLCGENGEYHTLVLDGPLFHKRINILETQPVKIENHWFLNITDYNLEDRE
jgi:uncharacterized protein (TIGR00290 family)